jgi:hypothetical protein
VEEIIVCRNNTGNAKSSRKVGRPGDRLLTFYGVVYYIVCRWKTRLRHTRLSGA